MGRSLKETYTEHAAKKGIQEPTTFDLKALKDKFVVAGGKYDKTTLSIAELIEAIDAFNPIKLGVSVTPEDFNPTTINNALNSIPIDVGIELKFGPGIFLLDTPLIFTRGNITVKGSGSNTILKCNGDFSNAVNGSSIGGIVNFIGSNEKKLESIIVEGITIDGDHTNSTHKSIGVQCRYVGVSNINTGKGYNSSLIGNNLINKNGIIIRDCVIQNTDREGIIFCNTINNVIKDCTVQNNNNDGMYLYSSSKNTVTANIVQNNNSSGIKLNSSSNNIITANTVQNNNASGIYLNGSSNNTVTANTVQNNNSGGMYLVVSSNNTVTGNTVQNNNGSGIYLCSSSNNNIITSNTVQNNNNSGICLANSINNTIIANTTQNNVSDGIFLNDSSNNNLCLSNIIKGKLTNTGSNNKLGFNVTTS